MPTDLVRPTAGGVIIAVRVIPRAGRSGVAGTREGAVLVRVAAAPVDGAANAELIGIVAKAFRVPKTAISIVGGETGRNKRIAVSGISAEQATRALADCGVV